MCLPVTSCQRSDTASCTGAPPPTHRLRLEKSRSLKPGVPAFAPLSMAGSGRMLVVVRSRPGRDITAAKNRGERTAGYRSGTGRSAMLTVGPVLGRSCRWRSDPTASAMDRLPDVASKFHPMAAFWFPEGQHSTHNGQSPGVPGMSVDDSQRTKADGHSPAAVGQLRSLGRPYPNDCKIRKAACRETRVIGRNRPKAETL